MSELESMSYGHAPVLIAAGGTGGHVYPALAVAEVLRTRDVPVIWLGTKSGIEAKIVKDAGFDIEWVDVSGLRGKSIGQTLLAPLKLFGSLMQAWKIFRKFQPCAVLGMGGFVAGPGSLVALLRSCPLVIHEQNSVAGLTNRLVSRFAKRVFTAFPNVFKSSVNEEQIGNPVRLSISAIPEPEARIERDGLCRILVVGGSRGARFLNQVVPESLKLCGMDYEIRHQTGIDDLSVTQAAYESIRSHAEVTAYIDSMDEAYEWADLMICRSGAMTVSELSAAGLASVLVPFPHAVDDHQTHNAMWLVSAGAALIMPQSELTPASLAKTLDELAMDHDRVVQMSTNARNLFKPDAAETVANALLEVCH